MKLLIGIMTCFGLNYKLNDLTQDYLEQRGLRCMNVADRRAAIRETWVRDLPDFYSIGDEGVIEVDYKFFYGDHVPHPANKPNQRRDTLQNAVLPTPQADEVYLPCGDQYKHNTEKLREMCKYALDHGFDYLMKADDDTFIYPDRLVDLDWMKYDYSGAINPNWEFHPGGAVILSRKAMKLFLAYGSTHHADDYVLGLAMQRNGIKPHALNFRIEFGESYLINPCALPDDHDYAALHSCSPQVIRQLGGVNGRQKPDGGSGE